ncbi:hypothetical protein F5879DRAFT_922580 [Lentinula edodes]|nr:hypothetical protein F5879DRAFT_922580 [Lentinula edodes]
MLRSEVRGWTTGKGMPHAREDEEDLEWPLKPSTPLEDVCDFERRKIWRVSSRSLAEVSGTGHSGFTTLSEPEELCLVIGQSSSHDEDSTDTIFRDLEFSFLDFNKRYLHIIKCDNKVGSYTWAAVDIYSDRIGYKYSEGSDGIYKHDPGPDRIPDYLDPLLSSQSRQSPAQSDPSLRKILNSLSQSTTRRRSSDYFDKLVIDLGLQKILLSAGILSYLLFALKMLWKLSVMFRSQSRSVAVGFVVPSVATYAFVQRNTASEANETGMGILRAAVDVTILAGAFICTFVVWSILSLIGDFGAAIFLAVTFGMRYFSGNF